MEVKVTNNKLEDYGLTFKVRRMNFDKIIVNYATDSGIKIFSFEDVECISENNIDEFLIKHRIFLKIKLKRGISVVFYNALYESLIIEIQQEITDIKVLRDKYRINKRGIWEKEILLFIDNKFPLEIMASGQNFKRNEYNIVINKLERNDFLEICDVEIKNINSEIKLKKDILSSFIDAVEQFQNFNEISK
jgi:hypothetical protein